MPQTTAHRMLKKINTPATAPQWQQYKPKQLENRLTPELLRCVPDSNR